jgi:hypothetical protein
MSNAFDQLVEPIPTEAAASYFIRLKTAGRKHPDAELIEKCVKFASAGGSPEGMEQFMAQLSPMEQAQLGAATSVHQQRAPGEPDPKNYAAGGGAGIGAAGAGLGALASVLSRGKIKPRTGALIGGLGGLAAGALGGKEVGENKQEGYQGETSNLALGAMHAVPQAFQQSMETGAPVEIRAGEGDKSFLVGRVQPKMAMVLKLKFAAMKLADEVSSETDEASSMTTPAPPDFDRARAFLEAEQAGKEEEELMAADFYAQKLREAKEQIAMLEQQLEMGGQEVAGYQEQLTGVDNQVAGAQQEGQLAQNAALQQVQTANAAAMDANNRVVDAESRALMATEDATRAKMAITRLREAMLALAGEDPGLAGTTPPPATASGMPGETGATPPPGGPSDPAAAGAPPADGGAPPQDLGAAPDAQGTPPPAAGNPGMDGAVPPQAALNSAPPGAGAPQGGSESSGSPAGGQGGSSGSGPDGKRPGQVSIKVGALRKQAFDPRLAGTLIGGAVGAGTAGAEAFSDPSELDPLRASVAEREAAGPQPGLRGFANALNLAKDRAMLTLGEATHDHPVLATLTGGLVGASVGGGLGPRVAAGAREAAEHWRTPLSAPPQLPA